MKTGCYGWGLHRKNNDLKRLPKKNIVLVQHSFLMLRVILLRIQLLSHRQLAKKSVHKDSPIGNIRDSDDKNRYYLRSTSYFASEMSSRVLLRLISCNMLATPVSSEC